MKRSKAGLVLMIIGIVLVIMAPVWKWGISPQLTKIPDNINVTSTYLGTLKLYVDPASLTLLPPELAVTVPLKIVRVDKSAPELSTGSIAVVKETQLATGPAGKKFIEATKYYAFDRKTSMAVVDNALNSKEGYENRTGLNPVLFPFSAKKQTYYVFDDDTGKAPATKFVRVTTLSGVNNKNITVFEYHAAPVLTPTVVPPLGLAATVSGAQAKALSGNPNLPLVDTQQYPISFLKSTEATVWVEPKTGSPVRTNITDNYYVDATALGKGNIKLGTISYQQESNNYAAVIDNAHSYFMLLDLNSMWLPIIFLVLGLIVLIVGVLLFLRKKKTA